MEEISRCKTCGELDTIYQTDDAGICMECGTPEDYEYITDEDE